MKKKFRLLILTLLLLVVASPVLAGDFTGAKSTNYGLDGSVTGDVADALNKQEIDQSGSGAFLASQTGRAIGVILSFLGIIFLILIIFGGIQWMTAAGNQEQIIKARKIMIAAIIGLVIVFAAYAITSYVGQLLTSS